VADHPAWLLLGSNLEPENHLGKAVELLARRVDVLAVSSVWQSPPADGSAQPDYWNAAVRIRTDLSPEDLISKVISPVEQSLGRKRSADPFAARTIDIDLALYDEETGQYSGKHLPHPDILRRAYFALPLAEISPDKIHPGTGESLRTIAARMKGETIRRREDIMLRPTKKSVE
jgi:2-amino-4-hydroxy-6-hydroxymethyldihydropteridine diphosphokinase